MIFSGLFHLIRVFDPGESHRVWLGVAGLLFIVIGVVLIRHLHLTRSLIGLIIGITWIFQGLTALIGGSPAVPARASLVDHLRGGEPDRGAGLDPPLGDELLKLSGVLLCHVVALARVGLGVEQLPPLRREVTPRIRCGGRHRR